jgi:hypothetical protein
VYRAFEASNGEIVSSRPLHDCARCTGSNEGSIHEQLCTSILSTVKRTAAIVLLLYAILVSAVVSHDNTRAEDWPAYNRTLAGERFDVWLTKTMLC